VRPRSSRATACVRMAARRRCRRSPACGAAGRPGTSCSCSACALSRVATACRSRHSRGGWLVQPAFLCSTSDIDAGRWAGEKFSSKRDGLVIRLSPLAHTLAPASTMVCRRRSWNTVHGVMDNRLSSSSWRTVSAHGLDDLVHGLRPLRLGAYPPHGRPAPRRQVGRLRPAHDDQDEARLSLCGGPRLMYGACASGCRARWSSTI